MADPQPLILVWLDANIFSDQNRETLEKLRRMFTQCMEFVEEDECKRFLGRGQGDPRRFILVISGALGEQLVPEIDEHGNILSIYVFCGWREKHEAWARSHPKANVVTDINELMSGLQSDKDRYDNESYIDD